MLFDLAAPPPRRRHRLIAASVLVHLAAAGALLAIPRRAAIPTALPTEAAVVFFPSPRVAPLERPRPAPAPVRKTVVQRRAGPRNTAALAVRASALPAWRAPPEVVRAQPGPIVMQGLTMKATARAVASDLGPGASAPLADGPGSGSAGGVGRLVDAGEVTEPPAVVARAELRRFYPPAAVQSGFEGDVKLRLLVAQDGSLAKVEILRDPGEGLGDAGARAIRSYRFRPARVNGEAVATVIQFTLHFVLG